MSGSAEPNHDAEIGLDAGSYGARHIQLWQRPGQFMAGLVPAKVQHIRHPMARFLYINTAYVSRHVFAVSRVSLTYCLPRSVGIGRVFDDDLT